jgi:hypothetical protein
VVHISPILLSLLPVQEREDQVAAREANLTTTQEAVAAQQGAAQVGVWQRLTRSPTDNATAEARASLVSAAGCLAVFSVLAAAPC